MLNTVRQRVASTLLCGLILGAMAVPTWAQKDGGRGSGGSSGGGNKAATTTVTVPLFGTYYGPGGSGSTMAVGSATLTFDATQTVRRMTLSVTNVLLPDGMIMHRVITDNGLTQPTAYYPVDVPQLIVDVPLSAGNASVSGSTANGDKDPLFGILGSMACVGTSSEAVRAG
jgi:hypothetical protein